MTKGDENDDGYTAPNGSVCVFLPVLADGLGDTQAAGILPDKLESYIGLGDCVGRAGRGLA